MSESKIEDDDLPVEFTEKELEAIAEFKTAVLGIKDQFKDVFDGFNELDIHKYDFDALNKMYDSAMNRAQQAQPNHILLYNKKK